MARSWAFNVRAHAELLAVVDEERQSTVYDFVYIERDRERERDERVVAEKRAPPAQVECEKRHRTLSIF